jgi:hypothetical protein
MAQHPRPLRPLAAIAAAAAALALAVPAAASASAASAVVAPPGGAAWDYQIGGAYTPDDEVRVVVRDREAAPYERAGVDIYNICYVNLLQTQPDVLGSDGQPLPPAQQPSGAFSWWVEHHPDLLLRDDAGEIVSDDVWSEAIYDVTTPEKRAAILEIQKPWITGCADDGFDAVEPDNLDIHYRSQGYTDLGDVAAHLALVIPFAHGEGLAIGQKNTTEFSADGPSMGFDFAIAESCSYWDECSSYTDAYGSRVYAVEYTELDANPETGRQAWADGCAERGDIQPIRRDRMVTPAGHAEHVLERCA